MTHIGFIVLPPGHGKSTLHNSFMRLVEADTLVPYDATRKLQLLREKAKATREWREYDEEWARLLTPRLESYQLVMVPTKSVGDMLGGYYMGTCRLASFPWKANLRERPGGAEAQYRKHYECWEAAGKHGDTLSSNAEVVEWVLRRHILWMNMAVDHQAKHLSSLKRTVSSLQENMSTNTMPIVPPIHAATDAHAAIQGAVEDTQE